MKCLMSEFMFKPIEGVLLCISGKNFFFLCDFSLDVCGLC